MTPLKKTILFTHRWLGFISGLVVVIVSITGCLFVFQDEIQ
ncbi:MAG TPA: PepSY domain-containing protein, partial [Mucilaginibacter sp.]